MVQNIVNATYTETYDLNTAVGELSLLAVHTPQAAALRNMFKGFFMNYKKFKVQGCSFRIVCASQQSLDPSQLGLEAGQVDPRDVLNPILFKACTGENLNTLLDLIYDENSAISPNAASIGQHVTSDSAALKMYYTMLADDSWRKAHPQSGMTVTGLVPMVHKVVTTQPFKWTGLTAELPCITGDSGASTGVAGGFGGPCVTPAGIAGTSASTPNPTVFVSNGVTPMPWMDTAFQGNEVVFPDAVDKLWYINYIPRVFMGCLVLPPAILQRLFFRLQIVWHISFREFRPAYEFGSFKKDFTDTIEAGGASGENRTYFNLYHAATPSKIATKEESSFTTTEGTEVSVVMEKAQ